MDLHNSQGLLDGRHLGKVGKECKKVFKKKMLGKSSLTFSELQTISCEIEAILNDRPIRYCYDELINGRCLTKYSGRVFEIMNTNEALTTRATYHRNLLKGFTNRWRTEYLQSLQEVSCNKNSKCSDIQVGEVVLLKDEIPRDKCGDLDTYTI